MPFDGAPPIRLFAYYLKHVHGVQRPNALKYRNVLAKLAANAPLADLVRMLDDPDAEFDPLERKVLEYYRGYMEFVKRASARRGITISLERIAAEVGTSENTAKRAFRDWARRNGKNVVDYVQTKGLFVRYVLTRGELEDFKNYLKKRAEERRARTKTYAEWLRERGDGHADAIKQTG